MTKIRINNIGFLSKGSDFGSFVKYYKNCFSSEEFHCVIADLEYVSKECCTELRTISSRVLDLSLNDREDFFEVYRMVDSRMYKENETQD